MTYYKYAERDATNQIDWNKISSDINKSMAAISEAKAKRREADQKALNDSLTRLMEKPVGEDLAENQRIANYTQQAEEVLLNDLRGLKRGDISRRDYNLKYNNVKMGTERAFSLSKQYQDSYQMHVDRIKADEASGIEGGLLGLAEQYGLASASQYYINPLNGDVSLALTTGEGKEGDIKIGDSQFDLMGLSTAQNIIFQKIDKYKTQDQVAKLTENLKTEALDVLDGLAPDGTSLKGYISTEKGFDVEALFDVVEGGLVPKKGQEDEANALLSQINATFAGDPFSKASFLFDTIGTIDGKTVEMVFPDAEGNFVDTGNHQIRMKLDKQSRYVPEITEDQQKIIDKNMVALVKNSIDTSFGIKADTRKTQAEDESLKIRRAELLERNAARKAKGLGKVKSTIMDDARRYLEKNIKEDVLKKEDDADVFKGINDIISEFGIELRNPINLRDGQSLILSQTNDKGESIENEIFLPSDATSTSWFGPDRPSSKAAKEQIINFVLENVNARALAAIKDKFGVKTNNLTPDNNEDDSNVSTQTVTRTVTIDTSKYK